MFKRFVAAIVAVSALLFGAPIRAEEPKRVEEHNPSTWLAHVESETEISLQGPEIGEILTAEGGVRLHGRFYLTVSALVRFGDTVNLGGGFGLRYESPAFEAFTRFTFDHRVADFPENAVRVEARASWWIHPHLGLIARALGENFPSPWNMENGGEWDFIASGGPMVRLNHHFMLGVLVTCRLQDIATLHHPETEAEPGLLLLAETALP